MMIGAQLAGASDEQIAAVEKAAGDIGMAFQIQDDVLDVIGNEALLGKPVHSDEKNEKTTWVTVYGLEQAKNGCGGIFRGGNGHSGANDRSDGA